MQSLNIHRLKTQSIYDIKHERFIEREASKRQLGGQTKRIFNHQIKHILGKL